MPLDTPPVIGRGPIREGAALPDPLTRTSARAKVRIVPVRGPTRPGEAMAFGGRRDKRGRPGCAESNRGVAC